MISDKHLWGESWTIYRDNSVWVVGFQGKAGGASSMHYHEYMTNCIYVSEGCLMVASSNVEDVLLAHGLANVYDCGDSHRLLFEEDSTGIETYYALPGHEIDENDIVRLSPGRAPDAVPA